MWIGWYSNSSAPGLFTRQISPGLTSVVRPPGSTVSYAGSQSLLSPDQAMALTGRTGAAGVFSAYCHGYPTCSSVSLWRFGASSALTAPGSGSAKKIGIAAAPNGRIWVFWWKSDSRTVRAVRTNTAGTAFGVVRSVTLPAAGIVWKTAGDAANGRLDLVVSFDPDASGGPRLLHTQVLPGLKLAAPRRVDNATTQTVKSSSSTRAHRWPAPR